MYGELKVATSIGILNEIYLFLFERINQIFHSDVLKKVVNSSE